MGFLDVVRFGESRRCSVFDWCLGAKCGLDERRRSGK